MANIAPFVFWQLLDNNGDPLSGGKVYTYDAGTTTPKVTYTDENETAQNTNPIILDSAGRADVWLGEGSYKFVLHDADDNLIDTVDDITGGVARDAISYDITSSTNITETYDNARIYADGSLTLSPLPAADAGDGFEFLVKNIGSSNVTIDPDLSETINDAATFTLVPNASVRVSCDNDEWYTFFEIGDDTVTTAAIQDDAITTAKIVDDAVTPDKIDINSGTDAVITASDEILFSDVTDSDIVKKDTVQGILDLVTGIVKQVVVVDMGTASTTSTTIASDDTVPLVTEGGQLWTGTITPTSASSTIIVFGKFNLGMVSGGQYGVALFNGSGTCIGTGKGLGDSTGLIQYVATAYDSPASTSAQTYELRGSRAEGSGGTLYLGDSSTARYGAGANAEKIFLVEVDLT